MIFKTQWQVSVRIIACATLLATAPAMIFAQQKTYDLFSYTAPKGWSVLEKENIIQYTVTDVVKRTWAQVSLVKSTTSKGNADADFASEWKELAIGNYRHLGITEQLLAKDTQTFQGWKLVSGMSKFVFNKDSCAIVMNTFSNGKRCMSFFITSNTTVYGPELETFIASINLQQPPTQPTNAGVMNSGAVKAVSDNRFKFNTTNFDDGWTSEAKEDWVQVTKGSLKVLIHFPREGTVFPADPDVLTNAAWNILVAPRYSNLKNYKTAYINTYVRPYLGMGTVTDNATGHDVFVVLYRQGQSGWLEFVARDKNSFVNEYKFDPETIAWNSESDLLKPLERMVGYNKFAIDKNDFQGTWTSDFSGMQQLYSVYTGNYAGMNIHQSNAEFVFNPDGTYQWKLLVVSGMVGSQSYAQAKSSGNFSVPNNWQLYFSQIEKGPKTYNAYWSCIKGARLLNLADANATGSGAYEVFGKKN